MISMLRRNMFLKNMINRDQVKVNALTVVNLNTLVKSCKQKPSKFKNKFNMLNIDNVRTINSS